MKSFVFLDLETTGTNPEANEIIEIGAVKLSGNSESIFQSLIKPRGEIPYYITRLTGIQPDELLNAPSFYKVRQDLAEFLEDSILVGHNLPFDLGFLTAAGLKTDNIFYDTLDIARLLLPFATSYSLSSLSTYLDIEHKPKHRALDDAIATMQVFGKLRSKAASLDQEILEEILRLFETTGWSFRQLFEEAFITKSWNPVKQNENRELTCTKRNKITGLESRERIAAKQLDNKKINSLFKASSPLGKAFSSFENRSGQIQMALMVHQSFANRKHLIAEAGTGIGKSLAYLLPSLFLATSEKKPIIVSTNTINLQEQLINKDIPDLLKIPDLEGLKISHLKGRSNYLCLRRWRNLISDRSISQADAKFALRILLWNKECTSGDRAEIQIKREEEDIWKKICSLDDECTGENCVYKRNEECFFYNARSLAEKSNLLIINHALLMTNIAAGNTVLPDYDYLVIDEAHHLESVATDQLGFRLREMDILVLLEDLRRTIHLLSRSDKDESKTAVKSSVSSADKSLKIQSALMVGSVNALSKEIINIYVKLKDFIRSTSRESDEYEQKIRLVPKLRSSPYWKNIIKICESFVFSLESVEKDLEKILSTVQAPPESTLGESCKALSGIITRCREVRKQLTSFVLSPDDEFIYWSSLSQGEAMLCAAPLSVSTPLQNNLFSEKNSVVLTSATLSSGGSFSYLEKRLGLSEADKISIPSPFDYSGSCLVTVAEDMPEPDKPSYPEALEAALKSLCIATKGKTLVLFTANNIMRSLRNRLMPQLDKEGILLLAQGVDGSAKNLLEQFRSQENTILFGTNSFWEGVDVTGEALSILVIVKLPFPVPSDPIIAARSEEYQDPFGEYSLPQAILKFKQGFGRLIRSQSDRGVMVVMDSRINSKYYGRSFLDALPLCVKKTMPARKIPEEITNWLGWQST